MNNKLFFIALASFTIGINASFGHSKEELATIASKFGITKAAIESPMTHHITMPPKLQERDFSEDTAKNLQTKASSLPLPKAITTLGNLKPTTISGAKKTLKHLHKISKTCETQTNVLNALFGTETPELTDGQRDYLCLYQYALRAGLITQQNMLRLITRR